ncbi:MAG: septal ring lytic transglycosylase RlpA family protein [Steroidobacteraceae bacterium]
MNADRSLAISALAVAVGMSGCAGEAQRAGPAAATRPPPAAAAAPEAAAPPAQSVPDAVPRVEPRSRYGNPPFYDVFGKRYYVLSSSTAYVERGVASWYGPGFHKIRTSTGEPYDMYGMTAAHKTLPLPAYVRVINLQNGRSVVVRVNDRGPFVDNRIIDLSYTAAAKLDMLRNGTAMVEVRAIDPTVPAADSTVFASMSVGSLISTAGAAETAPVPSPATAPAPSHDATLFVQAGAFSDPANAERLAARLRGGGYGNVFVRDDWIAGRKMYRVRIGPVPDVPEFDRIVDALARAGVRDAHLAMN